MRRALVFGASGQIGTPLLERLHEAGWGVVAVSRARRHDDRGVHWLHGDLAHVDGLPAAVDAIFSCGPLDQFARWYAASAIAAARVVAFGSTSVDVKSGSIDPVERELSSRLAEAERVVLEAAPRRGAHATLLRPTLVYGLGRDRTLSRIAAIGRHWGRFVLPRAASGLRQPVHVGDLADAAVAACDASASHGHAYALPGGETLPYREMVARVLSTLQPPPTLVEVPTPLFAIAVRGARAVGFARGFGDAALSRLRADLVFDAGPARRDFGYAPRPFRPSADMFSSR